MRLHPPANQRLPIAKCWLNVLEVPPRTANTEQNNQIELAFRTRVRVFLQTRCIALPGEQRAPCKTAMGTGGPRAELCNTNDARHPYHVSPDLG